jgi:hypothetical protein
MATTSHTYRFTHDGHEYTRTTKRTYTHAVLRFANQALVGREEGKGLIWQACTPFVSTVFYCGSYALACKASIIPDSAAGSFCKSEIIELVQP